MDDNLLRIFIAVTTFAVVVQAGILIGLYLAVRKSSAKMEALATEVRGKALPAIDSVQSLVVDLRPRIETISVNVAESTNLVRNQLARIDATLTDALDRTRLQVIRADELLNRTMDKVEDTTEIVHKTVVSPLRQVNGLMTAITTGLEVFLGQKRRHRKNGGSGVPQDEMFI
jgi:outer membrane murein-binding lipoprotein Lpp